MERSWNESERQLHAEIGQPPGTLARVPRCTLVRWAGPRVCGCVITGGVRFPFARMACILACVHAQRPRMQCCWSETRPRTASTLPCDRRAKSAPNTARWSLICARTWHASRFAASSSPCPARPRPSPARYHSRCPFHRDVACVLAGGQTAEAQRAAEAVNVVASSHQLAQRVASLDVCSPARVLRAYLFSASSLSPPLCSLVCPAPPRCSIGHLTSPSFRPLRVPFHG